jgi:hypothetical protein
MKIATCLSLLAIFALVMPGDASAACRGRTVTKTGPNGTYELCLDGKYSTCVRDAAQKLGYGQAGIDRCNSLRAAGRVK